MALSVWGFTTTLLSVHENPWEASCVKPVVFPLCKLSCSIVHPSLLLIFDSEISSFSRRPLIVENVLVQSNKTCACINIYIITFTIYLLFGQKWFFFFLPILTVFVLDFVLNLVPVSLPNNVSFTGHIQEQIWWSLPSNCVFVSCYLLSRWVLQSLVYITMRLWKTRSDICNHFLRFGHFCFAAAWTWLYLLFLVSSSFYWTLFSFSYCAEDRTGVPRVVLWEEAGSYPTS